MSSFYTMAKGVLGDSKKKKIIIAVVALLIAAVGAAFWYLNKGGLKLTNYRSNDMGISIKRPAEWQAGETTATTASFYQGNGDIKNFNDADLAMAIVKIPGAKNDDQSKRDTNIKLVKDTLAKGFATETKDITEKDVTIDGLQGKDLFFRAAKVKGGQETGRARVLILYDEESYYLVVLLGSEKLYDQYAKSFGKIINSFQKI